MRTICLLFLLLVPCFAGPNTASVKTQAVSRKASDQYIESVELGTQVAKKESSAGVSAPDWRTTSLTAGSSYTNESGLPVRLFCPGVFVAHVLPGSTIRIPTVPEQKATGHRLEIKGGEVKLMVQRNRVGVKEFNVKGPDFSVEIPYGLVYISVNPVNQIDVFGRAVKVQYGTGSVTTRTDGQRIMCRPYLNPKGYPNMSPYEINTSLLTLEQKGMANQWIEDTLRSLPKTSNLVYKGTEVVANRVTR